MRSNKATTTYYSVHFFSNSNDKNLRTILELLKLSDESFATKVINFGVVNVHTKILCKLSRQDIIFRFPSESFKYLLHRCIVAKLYQTSSYN